MLSALTTPTPLLDFTHPDIQNLIGRKGWRDLPTYEGIGAVYTFVRDDIAFGYNRADNIPASEILRDGYGQCNTKGILLMALLRAIGIPSRFHGFTIDKSLQRGVVPELFYPVAPQSIIHSWVEIFYNDEWINLEGFILDSDFLNRLRDTFADRKSFCGYGVGTQNLQNPQVDWKGKDTYIQVTGINRDLGIYETPDDFFSLYQQDFPWWKQLLFTYVVRNLMNRRVQNIRNGHRPGELPPSTFERVPLAKITRSSLAVVDGGKDLQVKRSA
ncbi:MAG TPA: transglutaminase family protein [Devosia sp.]|nr:transglutaminase family protein [Devosia sp.]